MGGLRNELVVYIVNNNNNKKNKTNKKTYIIVYLLVGTVLSHDVNHCCNFWNSADSITVPKLYWLSLHESVYSKSVFFYTLFWRSMFFGMYVYHLIVLFLAIEMHFGNKFWKRKTHLFLRKNRTIRYKTNITLLLDTCLTMPKIIYKLITDKIRY